MAPGGNDTMNTLQSRLRTILFSSLIGLFLGAPKVLWAGECPDLPPDRFWGQVLDDIATLKGGDFSAAPFLEAAIYDRAFLDLSGNTQQIADQINQTLYGVSALHHAAARCQTSVAEKLLNAGADASLRLPNIDPKLSPFEQPNFKYFSGMTALHLAAIHGCSSVVQALIQKPQDDLGQVDSSQNTALMEYLVHLNKLKLKAKDNCACEDAQKYLPEWIERTPLTQKNCRGETVLDMVSKDSFPCDEVKDLVKSAVTTPKPQPINPQD